MITSQHPSAMNKRTHLNRKQVFFAHVLLLSLGFLSRSVLAVESPYGYTERSSENGCNLYRRNIKTAVFEQIDLTKPFSSDNTKEGVEKKRSDVGDDGSSEYSEKECQNYLSGKEDFVEPKYGRGHVRYRRIDLIHENDLEPIYKWETRYVFINNYEFDVTPIEYTTHSQRLTATLTNEIDSYQAEGVAEGTRQLFTPDGRYFNRETGTIWKMYLSPMGDIVLKDTTNKYLPIGSPGTWPGIRIQCRRDEQKRAICGYAASDGANFTPDAPPYENRLSTLNADTPVIRFRPDKVTLLRRLGSLGGPEDLRLATYSFFANFDDPIRPVVFASGVLFKKGVKARVDGKYPASSFVDQEVCVADCPDQLKLQEQWINAK